MVFKKLKMIFCLVMILTIGWSHSKVMVWIQHPGVNDYYLDLFSHGNLSTVRNLTKATKSALCNSTFVLFTPLVEDADEAPLSTWLRRTEAEARSFTSAHQNSQILYRVLYPYTYNIDPDKYDYTENLVNPITGYASIRVNVNDTVVATPALPCILLENFFWHIIGGYRDEIFFTAEGAPAAANADALVRLTGILEPLPQFYAHNQLDVQRLEKEFLKGQIYTAIVQKRLSLCKLDVFNKFRLCSVIGAAWLHQRRQILIYRRWFIQRDYGGTDTCVERIKIALTSSSSQEFTQPVDLLPCAVSDLTLYIAADESAAHSVFSVQLKKVNEEIEYFLDAHVKGVAMLTYDLRLSLIVDA